MRFMSLAVVLCAVPVWASETENQALQRLSLEWMKAIAQKDEPALQALLAPEFSLTGAGDATQVPRAEWIANAVTKNWSGFRYENFDVRVSGEHATVNSRLFFRVVPIPFELDSGVINTWEKREGPLAGDRAVPRSVQRAVPNPILRRLCFSGDAGRARVGCGEAQAAPGQVTRGRRVQVRRPLAGAFPAIERFWRERSLTVHRRVALSRPESAARRRHQLRRSS